jgi:hypothetical protein
VLDGFVNNVLTYIIVGLLRFSNSWDWFEMGWIDGMCHLDQKFNSKTKNSRSANLIRICSRCLRVHILIFSTNLTEICWRCLRVTFRYFVQIIIPRSTCGFHVESRTLKLKARVHILKF